MRRLQRPGERPWTNTEHTHWPTFFEGTVAYISLTNRDKSAIWNNCWKIILPRESTNWLTLLFQIKVTTHWHLTHPKTLYPHFQGDKVKEWEKKKTPQTTARESGVLFDITLMRAELLPHTTRSGCSLRLCVSRLLSAVMDWELIWMSLQWSATF